MAYSWMLPLAYVARTGMCGRAMGPVVTASLIKKLCLTMHNASSQTNVNKSEDELTNLVDLIFCFPMI